MGPCNLSIVSILLCLLKYSHPLDFLYHDYSKMTYFLQSIASRHSAKASLFEIGKSSQGRSLWALALSAYAPHEHILLRPEVKYIGNMHGNEVVGLELLLHFIEHLVTSNENGVLDLMHRSRIWIMPSMNPDGLQQAQYGDCSSMSGRLASNDIDLNRNFPDYLGAALPSSVRAPETSAIITWIHTVPFVLSANYHGGAFIINVPFDRYYIGRISASSDDDIYQMIGRSYANRIMTTNQFCNFDKDEVGTFIRGADWYEIAGSMQDYGYLNYGTIEMTMEIACCKYPTENLLAPYWNVNREAMVELLMQAQRGVKGLVLNELREPIPSTQVMIDDRRPVVNVSPLGEFWRILLPGTYMLRVLYRGHEIHRQPISIMDTYQPLNLTIVIPRSTYDVYFTRQARSPSPFGTSSANASFTSYSLLFLCLIFLEDHRKRTC